MSWLFWNQCWYHYRYHACYHVHHSSPHPSSTNLLSAYPLRSATSPAAIFSSRIHSKARLTGLVESQNVANKSSSLGCYCVVQCHLSRLCHHFIICNVVVPWNAQDAPETSMMENIHHVGNFIGRFPCFAGVNPCWNYILEICNGCLTLGELWKNTGG